MYKTNVVRNDVPVHTHTHTHAHTHTHTRKRKDVQARGNDGTDACQWPCSVHRQAKKRRKMVVILLGEMSTFVCGRKPPQDPLPRRTLQAVMVAPCCAYRIIKPKTAAGPLHHYGGGPLVPKNVVFAWSVRRFSGFCLLNHVKKTAKRPKDHYSPNPGGAGGL